MTRTRTIGMIAGLATLVLAAAPAFAQDDDAEMADAAAVDVVGIEYAFVGLPTSVPAGTEITFSNDGIELHEIAIARIVDDTTESIEELLGMGDEALASGKVVLVGDGQLFASPGMSAEGSLLLEQEGRYVALCFIPQGYVPSIFEEAGVDPDTFGLDTDPATVPEEIQAIMMAPPHLAAGMLQTFTVTAAGTGAGPLPEAIEEPAA
jgi:plastocyanin